MIDIYDKVLDNAILDAKSADADAIVLLENIKKLNYKNVDGSRGFTSDETFAIIKVICCTICCTTILFNYYFVEFYQSLAKFHSLCIAMRCLQTELFNSRISPFLVAVNLIVNDDDTQMVDVSKILGIFVSILHSANFFFYHPLSKVEYL